MKDFKLRAVEKPDQLAENGQTPELVLPTEYDLPESWRSTGDEVEEPKAPVPEPPAAATVDTPAPLPRELRERIPERAPEKLVAPVLPRVVELEAPVARSSESRGGPKKIVALLAIVALAEAGVIGWLATRPAAPVAVPAAPSSVPITISSAAAGDVVSVDGRQVGVTPFQLTVDAAVHEVLVTSAAPPPTAPAPVAPRVRPNTEVLPTPARSGGIRFTSPFEIQVLEGEQVLGSSNDGPIVAPAGVHALDLVNSAFGYRERRLVEFKAGQVVQLTVTPPDGRLNINAVPWAQVWIDGKESGETPLANVTLPVGSHEIVFRHPQLGERRETAVIKPGALTRLSVALSR